MAQAAAPTEIANSELRQLSVRNISFDCAVVNGGDRLPFISLLVGRAPLSGAVNIDETGVAPNFKDRRSRLLAMCAKATGPD